MPSHPTSSPARLLPVLAVAVALAAGCGTTSSPTPPASATQAAGVLPLTVRVTGGQLALDDTVTVAEGGRTTGRVRDADVSCTLQPPALDALVAAARADLAPGAPTTTPPGGDLIVTTVSGPAGVTHATDADGGTETSRLAADLVADVAKPPAQRTLCR